MQVLITPPPPFLPHRYVPGRAWRAERLHGIVLGMARASLAALAGDTEAATAVACSKWPGGAVAGAVAPWEEQVKWPVPIAGAPTAGGDVMAASAETATSAAPPPPMITTGATPIAIAMAVDAAEAAAATAAGMPMTVTAAVPADAPPPGAVPGTMAARIETSELLRSLLVTDYLALCGLGALPPDSSALLGECRRPPGVPASRVRDLPSEIERFLIGDGPQSSKAFQRLEQLLGLLENLGLLVGDSSAPSAPGHYPTAFFVYTHAGHTTWHGGLPAEGTPTENAGPAVAPAGAGPAPEGVEQPASSASTMHLWRQFDFGEPSERAAYWVALKAICADELPKRGYRGRGAVRGGAAASHAMHADVSGSRDPAPPAAKAELRTTLPLHLPARAHAVLSQLKEAQWSTNRPLTSRQKFKEAP